jgi:tRNA pseudouridine55 synthase
VEPTPPKAPKPEGVLVVDKPRGPTSHDVVARVRRALGTREVGHAGTLDPMATGVLVLAIGEATKLVPYLTAADKAYVATVRLGVGTASLDAEGEVTERVAVPEGALDEASLERALSIERARTKQLPPQVSAIKIGGVAAHAMVRRGEEVVLAPRDVAVRTLTLTAVRREPPELDLVVECAKGYYVRALARDLASALGTVGHLTALRRTRSGSFGEGEAVSIEPPSADVLRAALLPLADAAARALPVVRLTELGTARARQGKRLGADDFVAPDAFPKGVSAWCDEKGHLVAVGEAVEPGEDEAFAARVVRGFSARS